MDGKSLGAWADEALADAGAALAIGCARTQAARRVPCHAIWDAALFAEAAARGVRQLALVGTEHCASCPRRHGRAKAEAAIRALDAWRGALSITLEVAFMPESAQKNEEKEQKSVPERRAFFKNLIPSAIMALKAAHDEISAGMRAPEGEPAEAEAPSRIRRLVEAVRRLAPSFAPVPADATIPAGGVIVDADRCTACRECVEICPTDALSLRAYGEGMLMELHVQRCIGCSACVDRCAEAALERLPTLSFPALLQRMRPLALIPNKEATHGTHR
ncbi:MAG: 4Fe-4S dicluster domain-containing protein [Zetaproteobacteria bacterium]|nr:MAG: 4Fe-4S dicluster domain-containing protein [Zetaproteobacteria bacterium]